MVGMCSGLWWECVVGPKDIMGHANEAWRGTDGPYGNESVVLCMQNTQQNNTTNQEMPMGTVLTGEQMEHGSKPNINKGN